MARQILATEIKRFIVTRLAMFDRPSEVRAAIKKEFNIDVGTPTIVYYDPTAPSSTDVSQKWVDLFTRTREQFIESVARQPIAHKAYRTKVLQDALDKEIERENTVGIRDTLEHYEKVEGGAFTNKRELSGTLGVKIEDIIRAAEGDTGEPAPSDTPHGHDSTPG